MVTSYSPNKLRNGKVRPEVSSTPKKLSTRDYSRWLNDIDINSYFDRLNKVFDLKNKSILLVDPILSKLVRFDPVNSNRHLSAINFNIFNYYLCPVNDSDPL